MFSKALILTFLCLYQALSSNCVEDFQKPLGKSRYINSKRYVIFGPLMKANWYAATLYCKYEGMELASINSIAEQNLIEEFITSIGLSAERFWTSGSNLANLSNYLWYSNGEPITFTNWSPAQPDNASRAGENCIELWGFKWNDNNCYYAQLNFVCEQYK